MAGYANPDVLVETQWVADYLDDLNVRLIEAAYDNEYYDLEHIPGALPWTWKQDFQHPLRKDVPGLEEWESLLVNSGIAFSNFPRRPLSPPPFCAAPNATP